MPRQPRQPCASTSTTRRRGSPGDKTLRKTAASRKKTFEVEKRRGGATVVQTIGYRECKPKADTKGTVLCLHGLGLHGGMWKDTLISLGAQGYHAIALDFCE